VLVSVEVTSLDPRVKVLDFQPQRVAVRLDPVVSRSLPVMVDRGAVPDGLVVGEPRLGASIASVRGASSLVARVHEVAARVTIDPSGINVDGDYDLVALDERGDIVAPVDIEPERVHVRIVVGRELASRTLPVAPRLTGAPPAGFTVRSVIAVPVAVTARGPLDAMTDLEAVATEAIVLDGRTATFEQTVSLVPPSGVEVVDTPRVKVTVEIVAERGSRAFGVGLALNGARDDRTYRLSVPDVLVTIGGTRAALDAVDAATLRATLDVSGLVIGDTSVAVAVVAPPGTTLVAISPARVTVTVGAGPTSPPGPTPTPGP
jgi:YbbR domain-containing protein